MCRFISDLQLTSLDQAGAMSCSPRPMPTVVPGKGLSEMSVPTVKLATMGEVLSFIRRLTPIAPWNPMPKHPGAIIRTS